MHGLKVFRCSTVVPSGHCASDTYILSQGGDGGNGRCVPSVSSSSTYRTVVASLKLHWFPSCLQSCKIPKQCWESTELKFFLLIHHALVILIPFWHPDSLLLFLFFCILCLGWKISGWEECLLLPGIRLVFYSLSMTSVLLKCPLLHHSKFSETLEGQTVSQNMTKNLVRFTMPLLGTLSLKNTVSSYAFGQEDIEFLAS